MTPKDLNNWSNVDVTEVSDADLGNVEAGCTPYVQGVCEILWTQLPKRLPVSCCGRSV